MSKATCGHRVARRQSTLHPTVYLDIRLHALFVPVGHGSRLANSSMDQLKKISMEAHEDLRARLKRETVVYEYYDIPKVLMAKPED